MSRNEERKKVKESLYLKHVNFLLLRKTCIEERVFINRNVLKKEGKGKRREMDEDSKREKKDGKKSWEERTIRGRRAKSWFCVRQRDRDLMVCVFNVLLTKEEDGYNSE